MSNIVQFLEMLGRSVELTSENAYASCVNEQSFGKAEIDALAQRDSARLQTLLSDSATVLAFLIPAEEEKEGDSPDEAPNEDGDSGKESSALAA